VETNAAVTESDLLVDCCICDVMVVVLVMVVVRVMVVVQAIGCLEWRMNLGMMYPRSLHFQPMQ